MRRLRPSLALGPRRRRPPPAPRCCRRPSPRSRHETRGEVGRHVIPCAGGDRLIGETPIEGEARVLMIPICQRAARDREVGQGDRRLAFDRRGVDNGEVYDQAQKVRNSRAWSCAPGWRRGWLSADLGGRRGAPRPPKVKSSRDRSTRSAPARTASAASSTAAAAGSRRPRPSSPTIPGTARWSIGGCSSTPGAAGCSGCRRARPARRRGPGAGGAVRAREFAVTGDLERALRYGADGAWRRSRLDYQGDAITRARRVRRGHLRRRVQRPPVASSGR